VGKKPSPPWGGGKITRACGAEGVSSSDNSGPWCSPPHRPRAQGRTGGWTPPADWEATPKTRITIVLYNPGRRWFGSSSEPQRLGRVTHALVLRDGVWPRHRERHVFPKFVKSRSKLRDFPRGCRRVFV